MRYKIPVIRGVLAIGLVAVVLYVKAHPLVFNESLWSHAHCMPQAVGALRLYAHDHGGHYPAHTNGYGDALLLLGEPGCHYFLTGPAYSTRVFEEAKSSSSNLDEMLCGRVYVQGLTETNDADIAILFDKVAAPPDHCHFPTRLWAGFGREVCFVGGHWRHVPVGEWGGFANQQVELLVKAGISRGVAEGLYEEVK